MLLEAVKVEYKDLVYFNVVKKKAQVRRPSEIF